jgi:hypothetical protein
MRLRRSTVLALTGLGVALASVLFFVITTIRDNSLLHQGQRVPSTVVRTLPAHGWDFFDNGRNEVRYTLGGRTYDRTVWLDDSANARPAGSTWAVVVDPSDPTRVRSLTDANDPVPVGFVIAIVGLLALLVSAGAGIYRFMEWRYGRQWRSTLSHARDPSSLSPKEQIVGIALVLLVDGTLVGAASAVGWGWFLEFGRLTLLLPTLATFSLWRFWRLRRRHQGFTIL